MTYEKELEARFEDLIDFNLKARGWSKIAVVNDVLVKFCDYVNSKYADNGNKIALRMDYTLKAMEDIEVLP